jgi:hypothetical protein
MIKENTFSVVDTAVNGSNAGGIATARTSVAFRLFDERRRQTLSLSLTVLLLHEKPRRV